MLGVSRCFHLLVEFGISFSPLNWYHFQLLVKRKTRSAYRPRQPTDDSVDWTQLTNSRGFPGFLHFTSYVTLGGVNLMPLSIKLFYIYLGSFLKWQQDAVSKREMLCKRKICSNISTTSLVARPSMAKRLRGPYIRVGQGFCVFGIQGRFKSGIRYIAA